MDTYQILDTIMMKDNNHANYKNIPLFKEVSEADWNSWKWQLRNAIRDVETLEKVIESVIDMNE